MRAQRRVPVVLVLPSLLLLASLASVATEASLDRGASWRLFVAVFARRMRA
jgi:hypothetical protein